jgi:outer membrane biosynthesis protein TonB
MATTTKAFIAGIGTTFVVLAIGFGGGLMMAKSALKEPSGYQARAASEHLGPVRVILPNSAEAAQPPQLPQQVATPPEPALQPAPQQKQAAAEKPEPKKPDAEEQERKRRYAERKARRQAEARARVQRERQSPERVDAPVMAYGGDNTPRFGGGFFGN